MADYVNPYYTVVCYPTVPEFTNEWNNFKGIESWPSQVRGAFKTQKECCEWARAKLPHGAPFTIKFVDDLATDRQDDSSEDDDILLPR